MSHQPGNISAGTQVVSLVEVRGTNNSLVHPRGAVGIVTRTPAVEGEKFIVRFPDGFETSLTLEQLEVLKHFKDRLTGCSGAVSAPNETSTVNRVLFGGIEGAIRFLNLADRNTGVLLKPPGNDAVCRLQLSHDQRQLACLLSPQVAERNQKSSYFQLWNYPELCRSAGLEH